MRLRTFIFTLFLLLPSAMLMAAGKGTADYTIWGFVRDNEGNLLPHADVYSADKLYHTLTDEQGRYKLVIPRDSVTIVYSYVGFLTYSNHFKRYANVKISARHDVMFEPDVTEIADVTVQGATFQYTTAEKIDISTINVTPSAAGGGIEGLIKTFQGVSSTNELSSQYSVRGGSYDENSVYVNG
ncbi:MAG: carboxypeptidase-like regulatory domain-containing protein, partial [Paludibacteraceae bacterium]|nr:carboxypeptidase-like regulatory domain-containing protein [Paludibacteraceae bacterium]